MKRSPKRCGRRYLSTVGDTNVPTRDPLEQEAVPMSSATPATADGPPTSVRPVEHRAVSRNAAPPGGPLEFFRYHGIWAPGVRLFRHLSFNAKALMISAV